MAAAGPSPFGVIERYREYLPLKPETVPATLGEGSTPLIPAAWLSSQLGCRVYLKYEAVNPTGSFKDRGMTVAITKAMEDGANAVICASTGNTSASAAAYAARAGMRSVVLIPEGKIAMGKLSQALMHGAVAIAIEGNFDLALEYVKEISARQPITLVNSLNPYRIEGQKTAAFEIVDSLGDAPAMLSIPVGNAGNITSYWKGFREYKDHGMAERLPVVWGFQAEGANPLVRGEIVEHPETVATAIRIGNPARAEEALAAARDSGGAIRDVTDEEILAAQRLLAQKEGVFCEPASAASVAGLLKYGSSGLPLGDTLVAVLTGHGLKDPQTAIDQSRAIIHCPADLAAVEEIIGNAE
ncbi:MAG: threonine synthase [Actinobacteria bacterium RBG_16_64_13]|nr:MAG: threonine synthase [Actinobacteria bacterium RBG_16_64_13]